MFLDRRLWEFTAGVRQRVAGAVVIGLLATVVGLVRLALLGWLLAQVFAGVPVASLAPAIAVVAGVMLLRGVLEYWRNMLAHRTAGLVQRRLRARLFDKIVSLGPAHFGLERTGEVLLSVVEGVEQLETYFGQYLPQLVVAVLAPVVVFALVAWLDLPIATLMLAFAVLTLVAPVVFHRWDSANSRRRQRAYAAFGAEFLDAIQGLATLKAFGQSGARARALADRAHALFESTMWVLATNSLSRGIVDTGLAVGTAATLAYGAYRVSAGTLSLEILLMVLMMGIEVYRPQRDLRSLLHQGMVGQSAAEGILAVLAARPAVPEPTSPPSGEPLAATVEFDAVDFAYPGGRRAAHHGLSFRVAAGERVAFVGPSGAGKSSIVRLLLRFYDPDAGVVRVGGHDLRALHPADLHRQIAVVNQDTYLFHGTVEENLRLGKPDATRGELEAAARAANAHGFIARLPDGYRTVVGERGVRLSGGQRQRIAIARAILRDAPILVLDEALSAVDAENEAVIQQALDRLMQGRTTLIFAHRLSSVIGADRILVLGEGKVVESGAHAQLMARRGAYHALMGGQAAEAAAGGAVVRIGAEERADDQASLTTEDRAIESEPDDAILRAEGLGWGGVLRVLMREVMPWKGRLVMTFVFGVVRVLALIGVGVLGALAVAAVKAGEPYTGFLWGLAVVAPVAGILHWCESWVAHDMAFRMLSEMRIALFRKLDALAPAYLLRRRSGDLVAMATHDVELVEYFFAHTIAPAFVAVLVPALVLAVLASAGWPMAVALLPFLAVVAVSPFALRRRVDSLASRSREAVADLNAHVVDTIQGLPEVIAFENVAERRAQLAARTDRALDLRLPFHADLTRQAAVLETATGLGGLAVVVAGAALVVEGSVAAGMLPLLTLLAMAAFLPVSEIAQVSRQLADTLGATRRLHAVHTEVPAVADRPDAVPLPDLPPGGVGLALEDVTFTYPATTRPAISDATFEVPPGATLAIVGPSGAGKTTVAHLLLRFFDPGQGRVTMAGRDLRGLRIDDVRQHVALVTQDTYLFNETLRANIALARPEATEEALGEAIERAALGDFVRALPQGLDTPVGERGVRLSGGQRQRVAIARAFLKDAPVLVLDEATSHLDAVSEQAVHRALEDLMSDRTTVVIAHRLSTVRNADRIVVLDAGRVAEVGDHGSLLARNGLYARLVGHQLAGAAE
ncbi:MAG: ABC transporter ATP-binding protein [Ectothiorhodospiraceae bacterium]|nr:ABC transporter ATP-binding protein [Chromatiales bacterium]MCP5153292.1 ABC transporter ATP-binding protein [Ectothiorhodospiraceae bacterium]